MTSGALAGASAALAEELTDDCAGVSAAKVTTGAVVGGVTGGLLPSVGRGLGKLLGRFRGNGSPTGPGCFVAGTPVLTEDGSKAIEDLVEVDLVWSFDMDSKEWELQPVLETSTYAYEGQVIAITLDDGSQIQATGNHPFWIESAQSSEDPREGIRFDNQPAAHRGRWIEARKLISGDHLLSKSGKPVRVARCEMRDASSPNRSVTPFADVEQEPGFNGLSFPYEFQILIGSYPDLGIPRNPLNTSQRLQNGRPPSLK